MITVSEGDEDTTIPKGCGHGIVFEKDKDTTISKRGGYVMVSEDTVICILYFYFAFLFW